MSLKNEAIALSIAEERRRVVDRIQGNLTRIDEHLKLAKTLEEDNEKSEKEFNIREHQQREQMG